MDVQVPTSLYRLKDDLGQLLYVGIAGNPGRRFEQHRKEKPWWGDVVSIDLSHFPTRELAEEAETLAIKSEHPVHNVIHNNSGGGSVTKKAVGGDTGCSLNPGYLVGIALREPVGTLRYYVGEIQCVDEIGVRISGLDWTIGICCGYDHWFPWTNVLGLTDIATENHGTHDWGNIQASNQRRHGKEDPEPAILTKETHG